ncbi:MAG: ion transporter [Roseimicrobium sp.]
MSSYAAPIVAHRWFQRVIIAAIALAGVLAGLETDASIMARHGPLLHSLDWLVLAIFILEAALKLTAHGGRPWRYFQDGWNVFDFSILVLCLLPFESQFAVVLRLARTLRLLRLVTALPKLQMLVGALFKSFSSMGYVGLLLGIMFYIYGITGVHLFGRHAAEHFGALPQALFTLFQMITLDNWSDIYHAVRVDAPFSAAVYFVSFILVGTMIMLNLFIGVIMNSMSEMHDEIAAQKVAPEQDVPAQLDELERRLGVLRQALSSQSKR